jgi:flagellar basal-body rod protein FlgG
MEAALWVAKTGLDAQQTRMTVIANNLANVNTTGFKRDRATFEDLLYQSVRQGGAQTSADTTAPTGLLLGTGTRVVATEKLHAQGNLIQTQNAFDLAISGEGFFQILQPDGTLAYTRDGGFKISGEGVLVNSSGYRLQPELAIPQNAQTITIGADGTVSIQAFGEAQAQTIGQIQLARFLNPSGLQAIGENLFRETTSSAAGWCSVAAGKRTVDSGRARELERQRRRRNGQHDRDSASLRSQLEGDRSGRRHAALC